MRIPMRESNAAEVRPLTSEEMLANYTLVSQLYPELTEATYADRILRMAIDRYCQVGCFVDGVCRGLAGYELKESLQEGGVLHVNELVVDKNMRGGGIGTLLLDWLKKEASGIGCNAIELESVLNKDEDVGTDSPLTKFYRRNGFEQDGRAFCFYLKPEVERNRPLSPDFAQKWQERLLKRQRDSDVISR
jgi:GNAT superfamily N-acetyltransferase